MVTVEQMLSVLAYATTNPPAHPASEVPETSVRRGVSWIWKTQVAPDIV